MKKCFVSVLLMLVSSFTYSSGGTAAGIISNVYINNTWTMVAVPDITDNPDNCESTAYYAIVPSDQNYDALHSALLAAHLAGRKVKFWVNGCGGQNGRHPKIVSIWVL